MLVKWEYTPSLMAGLNGLDDYEDKDADFYTTWLLTQINPVELAGINANLNLWRNFTYMLKYTSKYYLINVDNNCNSTNRYSR